MPYVITLLANPSKEKLTTEKLQMIIATLAMADIEVQNKQWLADDVACKLVIPSLPSDLEDTSTSLDITLNEILRGTQLDAITQPLPKPNYKLLISDMDSTMITCECIDELADFVGKKSEVSTITQRAMNGELNFAAALKERVALLADLPEETLQQCYDERVQIMPGAKELLAAHKAKGGYSVLVSGGFTFFTSRVADELSFDEHYGNQLGIENGKLTGRVILPILGKEAKLSTLEKKRLELGITKDEVLAIGDGANDLPMLLGAGLGVAYHAKPTVRAQAKAQINHCDLSGLKHL